METDLQQQQQQSMQNPIKLDPQSTAVQQNYLYRLCSISVVVYVPGPVWWDIWQRTRPPEAFLIYADQLYLVKFVVRKQDRAVQLLAGVCLILKTVGAQ